MCKKGVWWRWTRLSADLIYSHDGAQLHHGWFSCVNITLHLDAFMSCQRRGSIQPLPPETRELRPLKAWMHSKLRPRHTTVSELDPFPVKKSQKFVVEAGGLPSPWGVCLTQTLLSDELRLEQLPPPPPRLKDPSTPRPRRSWESLSWLWSRDKEAGEDGDRLSRLWWEWNWRMWRMDFPGGASPAGRGVQMCSLKPKIRLCI